MKPVIYKMMLAFIVVGGVFIGMIKGQQARTKWMNKMKSRYYNKPMKSVVNPDEIVLDDYEWQSFHNS